MTSGIRPVSGFFVNIHEQLEKAAGLRKSGQQSDALDVLLPLLERFPQQADIHYQIAWTYDSMGRESEAAPFYEQALSLGLSFHRAEAFLGLGSTYRCLGQYEKSLETFDKGIAEFPNNQALKTFRALSLYNLQNYSRSVEELLLVLLATTQDQNIKSYEKALRFYSDKLDQIWK